MKYIFAAASLLFPLSTFAAPSSFSVGQSLIVASSSLGNAYNAGISVVITGPVAGDLAALGGSVISAAPVAGDASLFGGSINSRAAIGGDMHAFGGRITIESPIKGDLIAGGLSVDSGKAEGSVLIVALNTTLTEGAVGPVTIYANNVALGGTFGDNIRIVASGHIRVLPGTVVKGSLVYEAPEPASISSSAVIEGGTKYTNATYLPNAETSRTLAVISIAVFLLVRILGALILAGLLAGLFPRLGEAVTARLYARNVRSNLLTMLLGFAIIAATPILLVFLLLTFVGIGIALMIFIMYGLLLLLSGLYAGILIGSVLAHHFSKRDQLLWRDGVMGMLIFSLIALIPGIGLPLLCLLTLYTAGSLLQLFFQFAFPHEESV